MWMSLPTEGGYGEKGEGKTTTTGRMKLWSHIFIKTREYLKRGSESRYDMLYPRRIFPFDWCCCCDTKIIFYLFIFQTIGCVVLHITAETEGIASHYVFMNAKYFSVDFFLLLFPLHVGDIWKFKNASLRSGDNIKKYTQKGRKANIQQRYKHHKSEQNKKTKNDKVKKGMKFLAKALERVKQT